MSAPDVTGARAAIRLALDRGVLAYGISRVVPAGFTFLGVALASRWLGPGDYARFTLSTTLALASAALACSWLSQGLLRFLPGRGLKGVADRRFVFHAMLVACLAACTASLAVAGVVFPPSSAPVVLLTGILSALIAFNTIASAILQAADGAARIAVFEIVRAASATSLLGVAFLGMDGGIVAVALAATAFSYGATAVSVWRSAHRASALVGSVGERRASLTWSSVLGYGLPICAWLGLMTGLPFVDRFLIAHRLDIVAAGNYAIAYDAVVRVASVAMIPVTLAIHPRVMAYANAARLHDARRLISIASALQLAVGLAVLLTLGMAGPLLLTVVGAKAAVSLPVLLTMAGAGCLWQLGLLTHKGLEIGARTTTMLGVLATSVLTQCAIAWWALPAYGLAGAACASFVSASIYVASTYVLSRRALATQASAERGEARSSD